MKSVLISIQPRWCELISAGKKTLEIRKTRPNMQPPFKCYIYCTKGRPFLNIRNGQCPRTNGTVIGEFICCYIDRIGYFGSFDGGKNAAYLGIYDRNIQWWRKFDLSHTCLSYAEITRYLSGGDGFAWNISDLKIYDHLKCLSEFIRLRKTKFGYEPVPLERPPQSWCYVEEL